jgi:dTDP-D-glucose 4,6-dehydratase
MYNIGSDNEHSVMDIARLLHSMIMPAAAATAPAPAPLGASVTFVPDRLFNDSRYCVDSKELLALGWKNSTSFQDGLRQTIEWYKKTNMSSYFFNWSPAF